MDNHHSDPMAFRRCLGKQPPRFDDRVPSLGFYTPSLPLAPASRDWQKPVPHWGDMLNSDLGDCTIAGFAHFLQCVIFNVTGKMPVFADADILRMYEVICGYNPRQPSTTDNGGVMLDVLTYILKNGFLGHKIDGFASVDPSNVGNVKSCINAFGGAYCGLALPLFAEQQTDWKIVSSSGANAAPNSWGGHCVFFGAYDSENVYGVTWGARIKVAWSFFTRYCDEAWAVLSDNWVAKNLVAPNHETMKQLQADIDTFKALA